MPLSQKKKKIHLQGINHFSPTILAKVKKHINIKCWPCREMNTHVLLMSINQCISTWEDKVLESICFGLYACVPHNSYAETRLCM